MKLLLMGNKGTLTTTKRGHFSKCVKVYVPFIWWCPLYGGVLYQKCPLYRDAFYNQRCPLYRGVLYTDVSWCSLYRGAQHTEVPYIPKFPLYRGAHYTEVPFIQRCLLYRVSCFIKSVLYTEVSFTLIKCPLYRGVLYSECPYQRFHCVSIPFHMYICIWHVPLCARPACMHVYLLFFNLYMIAFSGPEPIQPAAFNPDRCHQELVEYYHCHVRPPGEPILIPVVRNTNTVSQRQHCSRYTYVCVQYIR